MFQVLAGEIRLFEQIQFEGLVPFWVIAVGNDNGLVSLISALQNHKGVNLGSLDVWLQVGCLDDLHEQPALLLILVLACDLPQA